MATATAPTQPDLGALTAERRDAQVQVQTARGWISYWIARLEGANKELGAADARLEAARAAAPAAQQTGTPA